jgi:citrate lyase subunit beta/citryl-CoA lyase
MTDLANATTFLFVPGVRPDRFAKAVASGADLVILDLEDAVAPENKGDALHAVIDALDAAPTGVETQIRAIVRINTHALYMGLDLAALGRLVGQPDHGLLGIMLPKTETADEVEAVSRLLGVPVIPLLETAAGVANANEIAHAEGVSRLAFGAVDFARDIDATESAVFDFARAQIVIASRAAGLDAPIDSPCVSIDDADVIGAESRRASGFGFTAKMCIHPAQLPAVLAGFTPTDEQVAWATQVVALEGSATALDGEMIDKPVVDRARIILRRAGHA